MTAEPGGGVGGAKDELAKGFAGRRNRDVL
jgi:hypothetical protein